MTHQVSAAQSSNSDWKNLYRIGGVAAWMVVVLTVAEVIGFTFYPQPSTVSDWFTLFQRNRLIGLLDFWGLEIPMYAMFILVFLALYAVLRKDNQGYMAVAIAFVLVGSGVFFATNNPFSMLTLSNQYAAATTDAQRATILAAGQAMLANTNQRAIGGFNIALFLVSVAGMIISLVMLRNAAFSRRIAYAGIVAHGLSLADYLRQALTSSVTIALLVILPNALFVVIWFALVGRRLHQLGHFEGNPTGPADGNRH